MSCCLQSARIRQHRGVIPDPRPSGRPVVVVARIAARVSHAVDRSGAADHSAARLRDAAPIELRLRDGLEPPVQLRSGDGGCHQAGVLTTRMLLLPPASITQICVPGSSAERAREHATGGSGTDDDVIKRAVVRHGDFCTATGRRRARCPRGAATHQVIDRGHQPVISPTKLISRSGQSRTSWCRRRAHRKCPPIPGFRTCGAHLRTAHRKTQADVGRGRDAARAARMALA